MITQWCLISGNISEHKFLDGTIVMKSLDCTDIKALLSALVDDCVESDTRHQAERHLADCQSCRTLIDEAEAAEAMVAASVGDLVLFDTLPDGFKANVLARTVYADDKSYHPQRWTTWLGWLAAAASLALALTIWVVDNSGNLSSPKSIVVRNDIDAEDKSQQGSSNIYAVDDLPASYVLRNSISMMPASLRSSISSPTSISPVSTLTLDEIDALDQTVLLLEMFTQAPEVNQSADAYLCSDFDLVGSARIHLQDIANLCGIQVICRFKVS